MKQMEAIMIANGETYRHSNSRNAMQVQTGVESEDSLLNRLESQLNPLPTIEAAFRGAIL